MKITLYVKYDNFEDYLLGEKAFFLATLREMTEFTIPVVIRKRDYVFETASDARILRVSRYSKQDLGPR